MKNINSKIKHWIQTKMSGLNGNLIEILAKQFSYIVRAEHLSSCAVNSTTHGISYEKYCDTEIIVSLTTYDRRLSEVYLAIESIMQQTLKPNRIILWLGNELKNTNIPLVLKNQQKRGLEIRYWKDIRSYKKLIPTLLAFPSSVIITVDDDYLYDYALVENLVSGYIENPELIHCVWLRQMKLLHSNVLEKYRKWRSADDFFPVSPQNFSIGAGGVLYPPGCFSEEVFNEEVFLDICKYADDVWFKAMALLNNTLSKKIPVNCNNLQIKSVQDMALSKINVEGGQNDVQLKAVFDRYNLYGRMLEEL